MPFRGASVPTTTERSEVAVTPGLESIPVEEETWLGRATDPEGTPLEGVELSLRTNSGTLRARSDGDGYFALATAEVVGLEAELPGYVLVRAARSTRPAAPGEECVRAVLASAAELEVQVFDGVGSGIRGVTVQASPAPVERREPSPGWSSLEVAQGDWIPTGDEGACARLRVPAGVALWLNLNWAEISCGAERRLGSELVLDDDPLAGTPIVVTPGERLALVLHVSGDLHLSGEIRLADGRLAWDSTLHVIDLGQDSEHGGFVIGSRKTDSGRFDLVLGAPRLRGPLLLSGWQEAESSPLGDVPGERYALASAEWTGSQSLTLEAASRGAPVLLELAQRELGLLRGVVTEASGRALRREEFTLSARVAPRARRDESRPSTLVLADGRFVVAGLRPGEACALVVLTDLEHPAGCVHAFEGLREGSEVELRLPEASAVRARIRLEGPASELSPLLVLHLGAQSAPVAPSRSRWCTEHPWPIGISTRPHALWDEDGARFHRVSAGVRASEVEMRLGDPGVYALGLVPLGEAGTALLPLASAPLFFPPGDYVLEFASVPCVDIAGRVTTHDSPADLALLLVDESGKPWSLQPKDSPLERVQAGGRFLLRGVPVGSHRLRVASVEQLAAGRWQRELELRVDPVWNAPLVIEL